MKINFPKNKNLKFRILNSNSKVEIKKIIKQMRKMKKTFKMIKN